jgi:serine/threonine protein kinase
MGTVWKAEDDLLGRSVALKLLSSRMTDSGSARARLIREARAASALDHPGIGTVYDAGEQDGEIFIAMRLVDGGTVADRLTSQGALGLLDAVRLAAAAADALGHAHARHSAAMCQRETSC